MDQKEYKRLTDKLFNGSISKADKKRLFDHVREDWGINFPDDQLRDMLITGHEDYGKPDDDGIITEL